MPAAPAEDIKQELEESERRYQMLVESVVDYAIFQLDPGGYITTWNLGAQRIKGYSPKEIIGQHFSRFYTDDDRAQGVPARAIQTAAAEGRYEAEGWRVRKDGTRFRASVVIDAIYGDGGRLVGFAKVTRDITDRYEAQLQLRETQQQLAAAQKMEAVGQLSGGIAHDFNNLLMIVIGNLETSQRRNAQNGGDPVLARALANAMRGAQRATALTSRLLAFSRRQALDPRPIEVHRFLTAAAEFVQRALGEKIQIEVVGSPGLWQIEADINQLETAILNLAINARDAMPEGGKLTLEAVNLFADEEYCRANPELSAGQYVAICVSDDGSGMPPDVVNRAFEPFFTTKELGQGTGLGLSQVYGFIKQSGGHVKIYSEIGQGTTIKMYLPRFTRSTADEKPDAEPAPAIPGEGTETILIVEDHEDLRSYLMDLLRGLDYNVVVSANAKSALTLLAQPELHFDLLLTDVVMPGLNGRELGKEAHGLRPELPVLYMTGYSRNAVIHHGRLDRDLDIMQKPISQAELANRVRAAIDHSRSRGFKGGQ